jgi:EmrB/QacA subfamily drug resistance transporter
VFVGGLLLFALASLAGGLADSQGVLIAARAAQGLGGAVIAPASLSLLTTAFPEGPERNRAVGIWGAMGGAGGAAGVLLGGILTDVLGWRWILFINVPIGLVAAVLAQRLLLESRAPARAREFDLRGAVTATLGLSILVLGIVRTDQTGWGSPQTLALIGAGLALLALFVLIEGRFAHAPLMPLRIYKSRTLSAANLVMVLLGGAAFGMWFFVSLYLQQVLGYSPIRAGLAFLPMTVCIVIGSTLASRAVARIGAKPLLLAGMLSLTLGLLWFSRVAVDGSYLNDVLGASLLTAIGIGLAMVPATIAAVAGVARSEAGLASGLINTARLFGGALGLAILAAIATSSTKTELHQNVVGGIHAALTSGFRVAFLVAAGFALVGGLVALVGVPRIPRRRAGASAVAPAESA